MRKVYHQRERYVIKGVWMLMTLLPLQHWYNKFVKTPQVSCQIRTRRFLLAEPIRMTREECVASIVIFSIIITTGGQIVEDEFYPVLHPVQRRLSDHEAAVMDVCGSTQSFERMGVAVNQQLQEVIIHPDTWVFATRCTSPGKSCRGVKEELDSVCRPKKSWVQVYGRRDGETWEPHWIAVDTACVCSLRIKSITKFRLLP